MMRKIVAGLSISVDGMVDSVADWLMANDELAEVIAGGVAQSDAVLLGRLTYLDFAELWPTRGDDDPFAAFLNSAPKYIVSSTLTPPLSWHNSTLITGDLRAELTKLKQQPGKSILIPGSPQLARSLLRDGLLDELILCIHPIVVGSGMRLFDGLAGSVRLTLVDSRALSTGVLAVTYRPVRG